jgi:PAP2 superfamily
MPEAVAAGYFVALAAIAAARPGPSARRIEVAVASLALAAIIASLPLLAGRHFTLFIPGTSGVDFTGQLVRFALPLVYLVIGYWLPGRLAPRPRLSLEARLFEWDAALRRWLPGLDRLERAPPRVGAALDISYLLVYPFVPLCWMVLLAADEWSVAVTRFWTATLLAGYACYITLPFLPARPPRLISRGTRRTAPRRFAEGLLSRVSVGLTTFPSGHVAVALAGALSVVQVAPAAGTALVIVALAIAAATIAGRYHYMVDAVLGIPIGVAAWWIAQRIV